MSAGETAPPEGTTPTGIDGLDFVLGGGMVARRLYLVEGDPGSGKTTLALQFLLEGVKRGERCMFVTLSETTEELRASAASHGWSLDGIDIVEVVTSEEALLQESRYTMFHPSEVELSQTTRSLLADAERIRPERLVLDSLSEMRLLSESALRYRRQIVALKQHFARYRCTMIFTDDLTTGEQQDRHLHSLAHGIISLERLPVDYGSMRRRLLVSKQRGRAFREGYHDFQIGRGGLRIFPRLVAKGHAGGESGGLTPSGIPALDSLLGGGLAQGTSTLLVGPAGTGKSSLATQYVWSVMRAGGRTALFLFDEAEQTFLQRAAGMNRDLRPMLASGQLVLRQIDPAELSPGEFAHAVRSSIVEGGAELVVIDSLNGYLNAMPSERHLALHVHELLTFLSQHRVTTLMLLTQHGFIGGMDVPVDASYLADAVVLLRYFEAAGEVRQAISVMKKRTGRHERTIREMRVGSEGVEVGDPILEFEGVIGGELRYRGTHS